MVFRIAYRCAYYPQADHENVRERTQDEWDAYKFCGAVKHATTHGYFHSKNPRIKFNESNADQARIVFGNWMLETLKSNFSSGEKLVPVPSKDSWNTADFRSLLMVRGALPNVDPIYISPMLRFTEERQSAASGGPRGYQANFPYLKATPENGVSRVVLVDDIVTGGGTLLAARNRLIEAGIEVVGAVVAGRTTPDQEDPWEEGTIEVPDGYTHVP